MPETYFGSLEFSLIVVLSLNFPSFYHVHLCVLTTTQTGCSMVVNKMKITTIHML